MSKYLLLLIFISSLLFGENKEGNKIMVNEDSFLTELSGITERNAYFELGIRYQFGLMFVEYKGSNGINSNDIKGIYLPINLHLTTGVSFNKYYKIDFRTGLMIIDDDLNGIECGMFFQANLFETNLYGTAGLNFYDNWGTSHGTMVYEEAGGNITSFCLGLGIDLSQNTDIDLMYYFPQQKYYGYSHEASRESIRRDKINNGQIILSLQYSFIF